MELEYDMAKHIKARLMAYELSGEAKLSYGEWLQRQHSAWKDSRNHDGFLNSSQRNDDFDAFIANKEIEQIKAEEGEDDNAE